MANYIATTEQFTATANAIRAKTGGSGSLEWDANTGYADDIAAIPIGDDTSDANATASDLRSGKSAYVNGVKIEGNLASCTSSNLTASGRTVTVPAGIYDSQATKSISTGTAKTPATTITKNPTISVNSSTGLITATVSGTQSVKPTVSAGYVASGTAGTITVSGSNTSQLTTQAAQTITPGTTDQTIAAGKYLTGTQTIKGDANLVASNIASGVSIFGVIGSLSGGGGELILDSISVLTPPSRTAYKVGDSFSSAGMVVTASYTIGEDTVNNVIVNNSDLSFSPNTMAADTTDVTISYTVDGVTKTATQAVGVFNVGSSLNDTSWAVISQVAQAGCGDVFWDVGDSKTISLNGYIGAYIASHSVKVFILDFNHVDNGVADNNIIFGGFKNTSTNVKELALTDNYYGSSKTDGTLCFNMNHWGDYNYGGWKGCDLRYDILGATKTKPSGYGSAKTTSTVGYDATTAAITTPVASTLMTALPSDFRSVLRLRTHYVDNKGGSSNTDANVTSVDDAISLLSEFEVFGQRTYANQYEKNYQTQMAYYVNGNSRKKYQFSGQTSFASWWEASPYFGTSTYFGYVNTSGTASTGKASYSYGLAPAFKV